MAIRTYTAGSDSTVSRLDDLTTPWVHVPLNLLNNAGKPFLSVLNDVETDPTDGTKVFVVGERSAATGMFGVYYSANAGAVWNHVAGDISSPANVCNNLYEVSVVDTNTIYTCGHQGFVFKSLDGGLTFNRTTTLPTSDGLPDPNRISYALHFITPLIGVVALDGFVFKTTNGGVTWTGLNGGVSVASSRILGIHISANEQVINAFAQDSIWVSTDGGTSWIQKILITTRQGLHLTWFDDNNLWGMGGGGQRFQTLNAGTTWTEITPFVALSPSNRAGHLYSQQDGFFSENSTILSTGNSFLTGSFSQTMVDTVQAIWNHVDPPLPEPCGCPEGFTYNWETGICEGFEVVPIISNGPIYGVDPGNKIFNYSSSGTNFYESVDGKPLPISSNGGVMKDNFAVPLVITNTVVNDLWGDVQMPDTLNGRLNIAGIWSDVPIVGNQQNPQNEWIGFTACVEVPQTKTYFIGIGADNRARFRVNSVLIAELASCNNAFNFNSWHVFPITLNAGTNIIELEGLNCGDYAAFGAEIYDASLAQLTAMTLVAQLDAVIVFSTKDKIGSTFDLGQQSGYSCPPGYSLSLCDGSYQCVRAEEVPFVPCNCYLITECGNPGNTRLITTVNPLDPSLTYEFVGFSGMCWTVETSDQCPPNDAITEIIDSYADCLTCGGVCYELVDCEGTQPNQLVSNDLSALVGQVVKHTVCPDKCWTVTGPIACGDFTNVVTLISVHPTCADCLPALAPEPPLTLKPRRIKPGYNPPACTAEYIRKVDCNLGEAVFQQVASRRYGLKFCCQTDLDKWWIKKQLLALKSIYDPNACIPAPIDCCPPCDVTAIITVIPIRGCLAPDEVTSIIEIP